jgi:hypothetical protein
MRRLSRSLAHVLVGCLLLTALSLSAPPAAAASDIIAPGWDLLDPLPGTMVFLPGFGLVPFVGVPLGEFDFGPGLGLRPTGRADTIIHRPVPAPSGSTIGVELVAMQMVSVAPFDIGFGLDLLYVTLQAGAPFTGTMTFSDFAAGPHLPPGPHGTVTYDDIDWRFDVRMGALDGPIVLSDAQTLSTGPIFWSHFPPPGAVTIPCVNVLLDGTPPLCGDGSALSDFFPQPFSFTSPDGTVIPTSVPEPVASVLAGLGMFAAVVRYRRKGGSRAGR